MKIILSAFDNFIWYIKTNIENILVRVPISEQGKMYDN